MRTFHVTTGLKHESVLVTKDNNGEPDRDGGQPLGQQQNSDGPDS